MAYTLQRIANAPLGSFACAVDKIANLFYQRIKIGFGVEGSFTDVSASNPLPVEATVNASIATIEPGTIAETLGGVTTSSSTIIAANASRVGGWVKNISDEPVFVRFGGAAAVNLPTKLEPGESVKLGDGLWCHVGAVTAIHGGSGTKNVECVELST